MPPFCLSQNIRSLPRYWKFYTHTQTTPLSLVSLINGEDSSNPSVVERFRRLESGEVGFKIKSLNFWAVRICIIRSCVWIKRNCTIKVRNSCCSSSSILLTTGSSSVGTSCIITKLLCIQETAATSSGSSHCMQMSRLVKVRLPYHHKSRVTTTSIITPPTIHTRAKTQHCYEMSG